MSEIFFEKKKKSGTTDTVSPLKSVCKKVLTSPSELVKAEKEYTGEKPYSCEICGKSFPQKGDIEKHERIHTGRKTYSCEFCGKSFTQKVTMEKHKRIHL